MIWPWSSSKNQLLKNEINGILIMLFDTSARKKNTVVRKCCSYTRALGEMIDRPEFSVLLPEIHAASENDQRHMHLRSCKAAMHTFMPVLFFMRQVIPDNVIILHQHHIFTDPLRQPR